MTTILIYVFVVLYILVGVFGLLTWKWLRDNPVLPLNWEYEKRYEKPRAYRETNFHQVFASSASSATAIIYEPRKPYAIYDERSWR